MIKVLKYTIRDFIRNRWILSYFGFFLIITWSLLYFTHDPDKGIASLLNVILMLIPLISLVFGIVSLYNSREFTELLLAQPVRRSVVFGGQWLGLTLGLALAYLLGTGIPFLFFGINHSEFKEELLSMLWMGVLLTFIFTALAFLAGLAFENRIKGFGIAVLIWLFLGILYDGFLMVLMLNFSEYPLEKPALVLSLFNPIDLARIFILLQLDISALMGYTGAVFKQYLGSFSGMLIAHITLLLWIVLPVFLFLRVAKRKDF